MDDTRRPGSDSQGDEEGESIAGESVVRILSDHRIPQLSWWAERISVLPTQEQTGLLASIRAAWRAIRLAGGCDLFLSANVRNALALGLVRRLTLRAKPLLMLTEMRLDETGSGLKWRMKVALQRFAWRAADLMCVSARHEAIAYAERLRLPRERFRFVPWHTNVLEPRFVPPRADYIFAAGRTGRDWLTLAAAARSIDARFTVVCSASDAMHVPFPPNVTVLTDITYANYRDLLEGARVVVVPLEPHLYSSGQVVILEAMAMGKPVVASRVTGSEDYIRNGLDGMLYEPGDVSHLEQTLRRVLADPVWSETIGREAVRRVIETHTLEQYARTLVALAEALGKRSTRTPH